MKAILFRISGELQLLDWWSALDSKQELPMIDRMHDRLHSCKLWCKSKVLLVKKKVIQKHPIWAEDDSHGSAWNAHCEYRSFVRNKFSFKVGTVHLHTKQAGSDPGRSVFGFMDKSHAA